MVPEIDIKRKLPEISERGFIPTLRAGDTGIGYTLETELGIPENNEGEPDLTYNSNPVELKAQRENATSKITLITKSPHWEPLTAKEIIEKYGYPDTQNRQGLKVTLNTLDFNQQGLKIEIDETNGRLNITHEEDGIICYFIIEELLNKVREKIFQNLLLVVAKSKRISGKEHFHYIKAELLSNLTKNKFLKLLKDGLLVWEFRMHIKPSGVVRDHGAGFRLKRNFVKELYEDIEIILGEEQSTL